MSSRNIAVELGEQQLKRSCWSDSLGKTDGYGNKRDGDLKVVLSHENENHKRY